jgi:Flp pilus assembly protein TadD
MRVEKSTLIGTLALALLTVSLNAHSATRVEQESEQAVRAYQAKNFQEAASHFQRVVQLDPSNVKAWLLLGQSLAQTNDNMGARKAFAKVLALQSSGQVADRAREQFGKLSDPDLFTMQLDSGLTLGDWMPLAEKQITNGKRENVLQEIGQHLKQFGPVPQLLVMQEKLLKEAQAEREQQLQQSIAAIKVSDAESAKIALPQIRQLKQQVPNHLKLLQMEAKACHLMQDFSCAEAAYSVWLKTASGNNSKRKQMVAALMQAKQHEDFPTTPNCAECPDYVIQGDTVYDEKSDLTWARCSLGQDWKEGVGCVGVVKTYTFDEAQKQGNGRWRIPEKGELATLIDRLRLDNKQRPAIDEEAFPNMDKSHLWYWSSTPNGPWGGWYLDLVDGYVNDLNRGAALAVRLVRGGQ